MAAPSPVQYFWRCGICTHEEISTTPEIPDSIRGHLFRHGVAGPFEPFPHLEAGTVQFFRDRDLSDGRSPIVVFTRRAAAWAVDLPDPRAERTTVFATEREYQMQTVGRALETIAAWCVPWDADMAEAIFSCARVARRADHLLSTLLRAMAESVASRP